MATVAPLIAHRLGRAYGPDSSRRALARTLRGPVDGVETDLCLTADGDLALLHDPLLPVCTTLRGWAHERTAAELRAAELLDGSARPSGQRPMMLDELLAALPDDLPVQLDVKAHADGALAARTAEVAAARLAGRPDVGRFEVLSFHREACEAAAAAGMRARLIVWADYAPRALAAWARAHDVCGVLIEHFLLAADHVAALRRAGVSVATGTVNRPEHLAGLQRLGLDAVGTDRPHELRGPWHRLHAESLEAPQTTRSPIRRGWPSMTTSSASSKPEKPAARARRSSPAGVKPHHT